MKKSALRNTLIVILVLVFVVVGLAGGFYWSKLNRISYDNGTTVISTKPEDKDLLAEDGIEAVASSEKPEGEVIEDNSIVNILFIGSDRRIAGTSDLGRGDCCMLCSLNTETGDVKLVSFERGIYVSFDVWPNEDILTHTFHWGGAELMTNIIREYFLIDIEGYAHVDFDTFPQIIDAIGGVDITLTLNEAEALNGNLYTNALALHEMHEGVNHVDGYDALQYCRLRFIDSDWHRIERQRNTIQAIMNRVKDMNLLELNSLADTILPLVHTDLTKSQITSLMFSAPKFLGAKAEQMTVPYHEEGTPGVFCDFEAETERLREFIYD